MKILLKSLDLSFRRAQVVIPFERLTYFWGKMGAGKSSIARLIDYCLGGDMESTTALQKEFVSAALRLNVGNAPVAIFRDADSSKVIVSWEKNDERFEVLIPARTSEGEVIPGTGVESLSDLLFHLAGAEPPKVRKSKRDEDTPLIRLSFRDLFWYCYLDQDEMDSDFFNLGRDANPFKRLKSLDAFRYILGFHQEQVASYESQLVELRERRQAILAGTEALKRMLEQSGLSSPIEIEQRIEVLKGELARAQEAAQAARSNKGSHGHATDELQRRGRYLANEIQALESAHSDVKNQIEATERLRNELQMLSVKFRRTSTAREVLAGVAFTSCPRCAQRLPPRELTCCAVCGQEDVDTELEPAKNKILDEDLHARVSEINDALARFKRQEAGIRNRLAEYRSEKAQVDHRLTVAMRQYDSAFLSQVLEYERQVASLQQRIANLENQKLLPSSLDEQYAEADSIAEEEASIRRKLKEARAKAEKDVTNLKRLEELFLDCLLRAKFPGIKDSDHVSIASPNFLPEVHSPEVGELAVTSFSNLGSGGKKCVFKACYALTIHRLAEEIGANIPTLLIIDSPMKNISERENEDVFTSFYEMVYELAATELKGTQLVIIDKEFKAPSELLDLIVLERHMMPESDEFPPLIPYYRGL
ncbi:hypothetical protein D3870_04395 [Noviherbaspirillum cavernae]|uniref:Rad50/SbcC-type AAA domain-containing protein n=1 Tax=Noviherbaspirillum cavernae TaxID=2320862 RepID=A0A418WYN9_9BURK|nr:ATP-binding protein [Noviherbaspirillum cavernae]RJG05360.1 hypothetical protein D3870_04395 [Noviherbaspirillum cavernae]